MMYIIYSDVNDEFKKKKNLELQGTPSNTGLFSYMFYISSKPGFRKQEFYGCIEIRT